jgi:hypothetical protein
MPRCIYCGDNIPPDIGLRCVKCNTPAKAKKGFQYQEQDYDKEFAYDLDTIEPNVACIMEQQEHRAVSKSSQQAKEEFHRLYEMNVDSRKQHRFYKQEELQMRREGRILHMNEFLRRLRLALPEGSGWRAWFTDKGGMARTLGLYVLHTGLFPACTHPRGEPHYVGFAQVPFMQEFEELHFDHYNVPLGSKRRGYRTLFLKLIESKVLSERALHEVFGEPLGDVVSRRYLAYLQFIRNKAVQ